MTDVHNEALSGSRSARLDRAIRDLLTQAPELEAAAVVSFDGLPMAAALPPSMDEDRVAAMSAALLSLGERAAEGLGRGQLSQVYIEGDEGTVFLVSADDEAVLVAVAAKGAKAGMMLYEVRRVAGVVAAVLRDDERSPLVTSPVVVPVQAVSEVVPAQAAPAHWGVPTGALHAAPVVEPTAAPSYDAPVPAASSTAVLAFPQAAPQSYAPQHDVAPYQVPQYEAPAYQVPHYDLPHYDLPQYDVPLVEVPVVEVPVQQAPVQPAEPVSYATLPEPSWPLHAPTGSVMPGGGVPPSTWS